MRAIAGVLALLCLHAPTASAQEAYADTLLAYFTGDADAAVRTVAAMSPIDIQAGVEAFDTTRSPTVLPGAAAMHTEAALRQNGALGNLYHLQIATAIVEFGERHAGRSNATFAIHPLHARPVSEEFRRLWYCTVITALLSGGSIVHAEKYLAHALALYPDNGEVQLLAGVAQEMLASPRTSNLSDGDRRKALSAAEKHYRAVVAAEPTRLEARLRLARVLSERREWTEARTLLLPLLDTHEGRIRYLSALFHGRVEDALRHPDEAAALYARAATSLPTAQAARLAASELLHRGGDRAAAAEVIPAAAGPGNTFDPWWTYVFGEYWRVEILLNALRLLRSA
jgi:tetratricopeptide (TPR) repeat protein